MESVSRGAVCTVTVHYTDGRAADTTLTLDSNAAGVVKKLGLNTKALPITHDEIIAIAILDTMTRL